MAMNADEAAWFENLIERYQEDNTPLSDWEDRFFIDQLERWEKYGQEIRMSEKQWSVIDRIAAKLKAPFRPKDFTSGPDKDEEIPF